MDGIGATVKRFVWNAVMTRAAPAVQDAQSFYNVASTLPMAVNVSFVSKKDIDDVLCSLSLEKCFSEAPPIHGISRFHCIEPTHAGFVNCRLYSSQSTCQTERPPEVFPYDSCDSDATSDDDDDEDYSEDEEEEEKKFTDNEEEEESNRMDNMDDESEQEDELLIIKMPVKNVANDKHNHVEIWLGIPKVLSYQINQPSAPYSLPRYKVNKVEALLSKLIDFKGSSLIGPDDLKSLTNVDALQSQDKWLSNFIEDYMNLIQSFSDIKVRAVSWEKF